MIKLNELLESPPLPWFGMIIYVVTVTFGCALYSDLNQLRTLDDVIRLYEPVYVDLSQFGQYAYLYIAILAMSVVGLMYTAEDMKNKYWSFIIRAISGIIWSHIMYIITLYFLRN